MAGKTTFNEKTAHAILEAISHGQSLRKICQEKGMPAMSTVMKWLGENEAFSEQYARARDIQADYLADEILGIADGLPKQAENEDIQAARLRIDARKWYAGKIAPKKYGDVQRHDIEGTVNHHFMITDQPLTEEEWQHEHGRVEATEGASESAH
jgi:hypothetical protein